MHLWALNRGVLLTPFHNMALFSPAHSEADVDRHTEVFGEAVDALLLGWLRCEVRQRSPRRPRNPLRPARTSGR